MEFWTGMLVLMLVFTPLTQADPICNHCKCNGTTIDCRSHELNHHPDASDWPTDMVVTDVLMDENNLVHVTPFPPMAVLRLSYRQNSIVRIDDQAFKNIPNVTELDLSNNEITSDNLNANVFQVKLPSLDESVY
jgi:Leucine-rich repeat (LRR) protein